MDTITQMEGFRTARYVHGGPRPVSPLVQRPRLAAAIVVEEDDSQVEVEASGALVLIWVLESRPRVTTDLLGRSAERLLRSGDVIVVPAQQASSWRTHGASGRVLHVNFAQAYLDALPGLARARLDEPFIGDRGPVVGGLVSVLAAALERHPGDGLLLDHLFASLCVAAFGGTGIPLERRGGLAPWQVRRCTEYMRAHLDRNIGLDELANLVGLSRFHFARSFKASVGRPPHAQLRALRAERAKDLLAGSRLPIGDVALAVGYDTHQAFSRMFQSTVGLSPSRFRWLHGVDGPSGCPPVESAKADDLSPEARALRGRK